MVTLVLGGGGGTTFAQEKIKHRPGQGRDIWGGGGGRRRGRQAGKWGYSQQPPQPPQPPSLHRPDGDGEVVVSPGCLCKGGGPAFVGAVATTRHLALIGDLVEYYRV